jgi:hypothetical protein
VDQIIEVEAVEASQATWLVAEAVTKDKWVIMANQETQNHQIHMFATDVACLGILFTIVQRTTIKTMIQANLKVFRRTNNGKSQRQTPNNSEQIWIRLCEVWSSQRASTLLMTSPRGMMSLSQRRERKANKIILAAFLQHCSASFVTD